MTEQYDADYYLNGIATGKSNYVNYSWKPELTIPMAKRLIEYLGIDRSDRVLDVGCSRGYFVRALRQQGVMADGYDISRWAIDNCDPAVKEYVSDSLSSEMYDFIFSKDTFEHIHLSELVGLSERLLKQCAVAMLVIVPLTFEAAGDYVRKEDEQDPTHVIRWPIQTWLDFFQNRAGRAFTVSASWHVEGLKPTSFSHLKSCGFILLQREYPTAKC